MDVQEQLGEGMMTCTQGREGQFLNYSLGILARVRRGQQAAGVLLDHLATIGTLSRTQTRLLLLGKVSVEYLETHTFT